VLSHELTRLFQLAVIHLRDWIAGLSLRLPLLFAFADRFIRLISLSIAAITFRKSGSSILARAEDTCPKLMADSKTRQSRLASLVACVTCVCRETGVPAGHSSLARASITEKSSLRQGKGLSRMTKRVQKVCDEVHHFIDRQPYLSKARSDL